MKEDILIRFAPKFNTIEYEKCMADSGYKGCIMMSVYALDHLCLCLCFSGTMVKEPVYNPDAMTKYLTHKVRNEEGDLDSFGVDIFNGVKCVMFPVNLPGHWVLFTVCPDTLNQCFYYSLRGTLNYCEHVECGTHFRVHSQMGVALSQEKSWSRSQVKRHEVG